MTALTALAHFKNHDTLSVSLVINNNIDTLTKYRMITGTRSIINHEYQHTQSAQ